MLSQLGYKPTALMLAHSDQCGLIEEHKIPGITDKFKGKMVEFCGLKVVEGPYTGLIVPILE